MTEDLHSHTYYSACGKDAPDTIIEAAISGGIELFGICDHNYGIGDRKAEYLSEINSLKAKYSGKIKLLCGIEIATLPGKCPPEKENLSDFDYCLIEHTDHPDTVVKDICEYASSLGCRAGIAHTDLFGYCGAHGFEPAVFFESLAKHGIFWEMNVNYDSIHGYREHEYVKAFICSPDMQDIVRRSGIELSVGFDGHRVEDYDPKRVKQMCEFLEAANIPMFAQAK